LRIKTKPNATQKEEEKEPDLENEALFIEASKYKIIGNFAKAKQAYLSVISADKNNYAAMYELARLFYEEEDFEEALQYAKIAYEGDKDNKWYIILLAELNNSNSNFKEAANMYKVLTQKFPNDPIYWEDYVYMLIQADKEKEALKVLTQIENKFGFDEEIAKQKQQIYLNRGNNAKAIEQIENLIFLFPENQRYYGLLANMYIDFGDNEKAINTYNRLLKLDPNNPYAFLELATIYKKSGDQKKFNQFIHKAFNNQNLDATSKIAVLYDLLDKVNKENSGSSESKLALNLLEKLIKTHPNDSKVQAVYGDFYYKMGNRVKALAAYTKSSKLEPNNFLVWQQILFIHSDLGDNKKLIQKSKEVIALFPNQPLAYFFNGFANNRIKNYDNAIKSLKQGALMGSLNKQLKVQILTQLAEAYNAKSEYKNADKSFDKALKINPNNTTVLNNYSYYLSLRGAALEKAERMAKKANGLEPNNASFEDTYAWILYKMRKYTEAKNWLMKAYNNGASNNATILEHLGDVFYRLNQKNKAINYWQKALKAEGIDDKVKLSQKIKQKKLIE